MAQFGPNFKERFLGPFLTDANRHADIYPSNICPRNICPYKEYLSWYWPDFDQTLQEGSWDHLSQIPTVTVTFVHATFVLETLVHIRNISAVTDQILTRFFSPNFLQTLIFLDPKICGPTIFRTTFLPSSASTQLNSTSTSIEAEIALFPFSDTHPATRKSTTTSSMPDTIFRTAFLPSSA